MLEIEIDGVALQVEDGSTVIEAAHQLGTASPLQGRRFFLGGGRVPGRVRQRADGADLQGHL